MKTIKILGTGCPNCVRLGDNVKIALEKSGIEANVEKITDIADIMAYGVMGTPALVIDDKVVSSGKVNEVEEILSFLEERPCCGDGEDISEGCCSDKDSCDISCAPKKEEKKGKCCFWDEC